MSLKEFVIQEVDQLDENGLEQLADFLSGIKKPQARLKRSPIVITAEMTAQFAQFVKEDIDLAESGMNDYAQILERVDK